MVKLKVSLVLSCMLLVACSICAFNLSHNIITNDVAGHVMGGNMLDQEKVDAKIKEVIETKGEEIYKSISITEDEIQERYSNYTGTKLYKVILEDGSKTIKEENRFAIGENITINEEAYKVIGADIATEEEVKGFLTEVMIAEQYNEKVVAKALEEYNN